MNTRAIDGVWQGRYEYGRGSSDEPQVGHHKMTFTYQSGEWHGKSLSTEDGSEIDLVLTQEGKEFSGTWCERTSPQGYYRGREFKGLILLAQNDDGNELIGMWLGTSSNSGRVKTGKWAFVREEEE